MKNFDIFQALYRVGQLPDSLEKTELYGMTTIALDMRINGQEDERVTKALRIKLEALVNRTENKSLQ